MPVSLRHAHEVLRAFARLESDPHATVLTEIPDIARGHVRPGAMACSKRNAFVARWSGREWALRQHQAEAGKACVDAARAGSADEAPQSGASSR
jgi:hypothetical protein